MASATFWASGPVPTIEAETATLSKTNACSIECGARHLPPFTGESQAAGLVLGGADQQGHRLGYRRRVGLERVARQGASVDHRAEGGAGVDQSLAQRGLWYGLEAGDVALRQLQGGHDLGGRGLGGVG